MWIVDVLVPDGKIVFRIAVLQECPVSLRSLASMAACNR